MLRKNPLLKTAAVTAISSAIALLAGPVQAAAAQNAKLIPNQYIVVLDQAALPAAVSHLGVAALAQNTLARVGGGTVLSRYSTALTGFSARITAKQAAALAKLQARADEVARLLDKDSARLIEINLNGSQDFGTPMFGLSEMRLSAAAGAMSVPVAEPSRAQVTFTVNARALLSP